MRRLAATTDNITDHDIEVALECAIPLSLENSLLLFQLLHKAVKFRREDAILAAGAVPVLFEVLRFWQEDSETVEAVCNVLSHLCEGRNVAVKSAILAVPDCEALLRSAANIIYQSNWTRASRRLGHKSDVFVFDILNYIGVIAENDELVRCHLCVIPV